MDRDAMLSRIGREIDRRNKTDMRIYPSMIFAILITYSAVALYRGFFEPESAEVRSFSVVVVGSGLVLAIMYVLVTRVYRHNKRDAVLMSDVCTFLSYNVPDGESNPNVRIMRENTYDGIAQTALFVLFFVALAPAAIGALIYARGLTDDADDLALRLNMISFVLGLIIILVNINYSKGHERRFIRFSNAAVAAFASLGISVGPYQKVIGGRNVYFMILLCILTLGFFVIIWLCISMRDFNRHMDAQWNFEDNLYEALKLIGPQVPEQLGGEPSPSVC